MKPIRRSALVAVFLLSLFLFLAAFAAPEFTTAPPPLLPL